MIGGIRNGRKIDELQELARRDRLAVVVKAISVPSTSDSATAASADEQRVAAAPR